MQCMVAVPVLGVTQPLAIATRRGTAQVQQQNSAEMHVGAGAQGANGVKIRSENYIKEKKIGMK